MGTSIPLSEEFRDELKEAKRDGESYESYLRRRLSSDGPDESDGSDGPDVSDVLSRMDDLEATIPSKTAEELGRQFR